MCSKGVAMNTGEKIDYMIQCLQVAKAEHEYTADYVANEPTERTELWKFLDTHRSPNKELINDNLKNVARMGSQLANEVMMTVREEQVLCKLHEFIEANDINCAEDVTQRDSISEQCVDLVEELVDTLCYK